MEASQRKVICLIRDPPADPAKINEIKATIIRNHPHLDGSGTLIIEVITSNQFIHQKRGYLLDSDGSFFIDHYHIYTQDGKITYHYSSFYAFIHHLSATGQFGKILYFIHQYEKYQVASGNIPLEGSNDADALSLCYHFYAKALERMGMDDIAVIEAYKQAHQISNKNLISIHELFIKLRMNGNLEEGVKLYREVYDQYYPVTSLANDSESGELYTKRLAEIRESNYFGAASGNFPIPICYLELEIIDLLVRARDYRTAFQIGNRIMIRPEMIPDYVTREIQLRKAECMDHIKNDLDWIGYPAEKIAQLTEKRMSLNRMEMELQNRSSSSSSSPTPPGIIFTITTCKRFDLFEKTINSLINCAPPSDLEMITEWFCVDDNSSEEDRKQMMERYPFFRFVFKGLEQKGHIISMNIIRDYVLAKGYKYTMHFEDDWQSICPIATIQRSIDIMDADPTIKQVVHNRNYVQMVRRCDIQMPGGYLMQVPKTGHRYILHQFYVQGSPEFIEFQQKVGFSISNWPYYSLNPSVLDTTVYRTLGPFEKRTWHFEFDYAAAYLCAGFRTAFLDGIYRNHIGKILGDTNGKNAYELNEIVKE